MPNSQRGAPNLNLIESTLPIKLLYHLTSIKIHVYISAFAYCVGGRVYIGHGVLVWASSSRSICDWVLRWEGSTSLSKSLYLGRIDNGLQIDYEWLKRVENGCLVWYRGNSERFRDIWDKGDVTMSSWRYLCDGVSFIHLLIYWFVNNIYISKTKNNT